MHRLSLFSDRPWDTATTSCKYVPVVGAIAMPSEDSNLHFRHWRCFLQLKLSLGIYSYDTADSEWAASFPVCSDKPVGSSYHMKMAYTSWREQLMKLLWSSLGSYPKSCPGLSIHFLSLPVFQPSYQFIDWTTNIYTRCHRVPYVCTVCTAYISLRCITGEIFRDLAGTFWCSRTSACGESRYTFSLNRSTKYFTCTSERQVPNRETRRDAIFC